jgi:ABC-type transporter Mla MlaB component
VLKIATRSDPAGAATLLLAGCVNQDSLDQIEQALDLVRSTHKEVQIDLSEVTLVDRLGLRFLAAQRRRDVKLIKCPQYIRPWMRRALVDRPSRES